MAGTKSKTVNKRTPKIKKLDKFDNTYFWQTRKKAEETQANLEQAQEVFNQAHIAHSGAAQMIKTKYQLKDTDVVEKDGLVVDGSKNQKDI